jgi:hypothetical protein
VSSRHVPVGPWRDETGYGGEEVCVLRTGYGGEGVCVLRTGCVLL